MDYSNIQQITTVSSNSILFSDDNIELKDPVKEVNRLLKDGWILLAINHSMNEDHTSSVSGYVLGLPKLNSSK